MKRKIKVFILLILVIMCTTLLSYAKINKGKVNSSNGMFAIFLEEEKDSGKYQKSNLRTWPTDDEYVINISKSYCENGSVLRWNNETKKIRLKVTGTDKCYIYFDKGEYGTIKNPHLIQTIEDLVRLSNNVNKGTNYAGEYFLLTTDLDFENPDDYENANRTDFGDINGINGDEPLIKELTTGSGFLPIGKNVHFAGNFDGNNKKIMNLFIHDDKVESTKANGLFGRILNNVIQNLTVSGNISTKYEENMGGIIGVATNSTIKNCHNEVNVISEAGDWSTGGVLGTPYEKVDIVNCSNSGNVTGGAWIGGIVGGVGTGSVLTIDNCSNSGKIQKKDAINYVGVGGIIGGAIAANEVENIVINNSNNTGEIIVNTNLNKIVPIGGLIGRSDAVTIINNSYNLATLETAESSLAIIGGLVGLNNNNLTINESHNKGNIINNSGYIIGGLLGEDYVASNKTNIINSYNEGNISNNPEDKDIYLGGIVGKILGSIDISDSYNLGELNLERTNFTNAVNLTIGGLIGFLSGNGELSTIKNSYNGGNLYNGTKSGGIIGFDTLRTSITIIDKCYNAGNITTNVIAGTNNTTQAGIVGYTYSSSKTYILNSYNKGNITSAKIATGIGWADTNGTIYALNTYNVGNITGDLGAGGLLGSGIASIYAYNSYNIGKLSSSLNKVGGICFNNNMKIINNVYYENSVSASNVSGVEGTPMAIDDMKQQTFVDTLNKNVDDIDLETINTLLKGYTLSKWTLSEDDYPTLINE